MMQYPVLKGSGAEEKQHPVQTSWQKHLKSLFKTYKTSQLRGFLIFPASSTYPCGNTPKQKKASKFYNLKASKGRRLPTLPPGLGQYHRHKCV